MKTNDIVYYAEIVHDESGHYGVRVSKCRVDKVIKWDEEDVLGITINMSGIMGVNYTILESKLIHQSLGISKITFKDKIDDWNTSDELFNTEEEAMQNLLMDYIKERGIIDSDIATICKTIAIEKE